MPWSVYRGIVVDSMRLPIGWERCRQKVLKEGAVDMCFAW
jgi:hypothetical protein